MSTGEILSDMRGVLMRITILASWVAGSWLKTENILAIPGNNGRFMIFHNMFSICFPYVFHMFSQISPMHLQAIAQFLLAWGWQTALMWASANQALRWQLLFLKSATGRLEGFWGWGWLGLGLLDFLRVQEDFPLL